MDNCVFPPEIIDQTIDQLFDDLPSLSQCALVSRNWLPTSRIHLYHTVRVKFREDLRSLRYEHPKKLDLVLQTLIDSPALMGYIRAFHLDCERTAIEQIHPNPILAALDPNVCIQTEENVAAVLETIFKIGNIQRFVFNGGASWTDDGLAFTPRLAKAMEQLGRASSLMDLELHGLSSMLYIAAPNVQHLRLRWWSFPGHAVQNMHQYTARLKSLHFDSVANVEHLVGLLMTPGCLWDIKALQHLHGFSGHSDIDDFNRLLERCGNSLTSLSLHSGGMYALPDSAIRLALCPSLEYLGFTLSGPLESEAGWIVSVLSQVRQANVLRHIIIAFEIDSQNPRKLTWTAIEEALCSPRFDRLESITVEVTDRQWISQMPTVQEMQTFGPFVDEIKAELPCLASRGILAVEIPKLEMSTCGFVDRSLAARRWLA
ncbi:hypothetical protein C8J56DRAFT_277147 [Mycena floridula]|nr:hypothetical protein C8J56DRAFT_277147 [Mycena floridula]